MSQSSQSRTEFLLPKRIERYLGALSKMYGQEGERTLQEIIVNGRISVVEGHSFDNWNGGTWGHALDIVLPDEMFFQALKDRDSLSIRIAHDLNNLNSTQDEFIDVVRFEIDEADTGDWRAASGILHVPGRQVPATAEHRIWRKDRYRVFLSHKSEVKALTASLKNELDSLGASCFVAHEDIQPTHEWQEEIENALATTDAFVALVTTGFHDSVWTNQEVGYALARGLPIIAVKLDADPKGFIGRKQALACNWADAPLEIAKLLANQDRMLAGYICAMRECKNFNEANRLALLLPHLTAISPSRAEEMVTIYNSNDEVRGGFGFNGSRPASFGPGLIHHLMQSTTKKYRYGDFRKIEPA